MVYKFSRSLHFLVFIFPFLFTHIALGQAESKIKQAIQNALNQQKLTGAVWATVTPGGTIHAACTGINNNETQKPFQVTDKVQVGSVTKTVLAAGVLRLATEGKIKLDAPLSNYLPNVPFNNPWEDTNPITVRHLLDHTSGIGDLRLWHFLSTSATSNTSLVEFYQKDPSVLVVQAKPGTIFSYSNMGYTLLGLVIESVTKQRYEEYLDENLLKPIGMTNSTFKFVSQKSAGSALAMGHLDKGQPYTAYPMYIRPAGQFTTTANDMGLLLRFMMSDGIINGKQFISNLFLSQLGKAHQTDASKQGLPFGYALGTSIRDRHGVLGITHSGNIVGYRAMIYMFPEEQKAFFIAHNMDSETADYEVFNKLLIEHLELPVQLPLLTKGDTKEVTDWNGYYIPAIVKVAPFGFLDFIFSFTKVKITPKGALLSSLQKDPVFLNYLGNHTFIAKDKTTPSHAFYIDENGQHFITSGLSTIKKTKGLYILLGGLSLATGLISMIFLLISWLYKVIALNKNNWKHPLAWHSLAVAIMLVAIILLMNQSFVSLGDRAVSSLMLTSGTILWPILTTFTIYKYIRSDLSTVLIKLELLALMLVLQLTFVLGANGLIPLQLWK